MATEFITKKIKNGLIATLETLGATENGTQLQEVSGSSTNIFDSYPALRVLPNDVDNETETNRSDQRAAKFTLLVHIEVEKDSSVSEEEAYDTMYDFQDLIFDKLQEYDWQNTLNILQVQAKYGGYEFLEMKNGLNLVFRIDVTATYSRNV